MGERDHIWEGRATVTRRQIFGWQLQAFANLVIETLGEFFIRASNCKVVNLAQEKDFGAFESGRAYRIVMSGAFEANLW